MIVAAAEFYAAQGSVEKGEELLTRAPASCAPDERRALQAQFLERHGRAEQAEGIRAALAAGGSAQALSDLASLYIRQRRMDEARAALQRARQADPQNPGVRRTGALLRVLTEGSGGEAWRT
jgi:thioredoxin-like negative regulator of GroEL